MEDNYLRNCGNSDGESDAAIAKEMLVDFVSAGSVKECKLADVKQKIAQFKTNYNIAYKWTQTIGSALNKDNIDFIGACKF